MATGFLNFDKKHAVAGSSKLKATHSGHIYNIVVTDDELDNGTIVSKGDYVKMETYKQAPASNTFAAVVRDKAANGNYYVEVTACEETDLLVLQVPLIYENYTTRMKHESNFYNVKDDIVRAYELYVGDIFELSVEGFTATPQIGDELTVDAATHKLAKA